MTAHYPDAEAARRTVLVAVINNAQICAAPLKKAGTEFHSGVPRDGLGPTFWLST